MCLNDLLQGIHRSFNFRNCDNIYLVLLLPHTAPEYFLFHEVLVTCQLLLSEPDIRKYSEFVCLNYILNISKKLSDD